MKYWIYYNTIEQCYNYIRSWIEPGDVIDGPFDTWEEVIEALKDYR